MTEESRNRPELVIKAVGPLLVLAGLIFGVIQFQATAKLDREAQLSVMRRSLFTSNNWRCILKQQT